MRVLIFVELLKSRNSRIYSHLLEYAARGQSTVYAAIAQERQRQEERKQEEERKREAARYNSFRAGRVNIYSVIGFRVVRLFGRT